jgi:negative regulator of replication initiation
MKTINIEEDIFFEIDKLATGIFSHSDVIKKLLSHQNVQKTEIQPITNAELPSQKGSLAEFVHGPKYQSLRKVGDRYLVIWGWVGKHHPKEFTKLEEFKRGKRIYFSSNSKAILESGKGNIKAKQIPGTSLWALVTLDSAAMRQIVVDGLHLMGFRSDDIKAVADTVAGRSRGLTGLNLNL